MKGSSIIKL